MKEHFDKTLVQLHSWWKFTLHLHYNRIFLVIGVTNRVWKVTVSHIITLMSDAPEHHGVDLISKCIIELCSLNILSTHSILFYDICMYIFCSNKSSSNMYITSLLFRIIFVCIWRKIMCSCFCAGINIPNACILFL